MKMTIPRKIYSPANLDYFSTEARLKVRGTSFALRLEFISVSGQQTLERMPHDYQLIVGSKFILYLGHCEVAEPLKCARGVSQIRRYFQRRVPFPFSGCDHQHAFPVCAGHLNIIGQFMVKNLFL